MIEKFEVGKYYRYTGTKKSFWNSNSKMDAVLDGKPRRCTEAVCGRSFSANFTNVRRSEEFPWCWGSKEDLKDWEESLSIREKLDIILGE